MNQFLEVVQRYGWRSPIVVVVIALGRISSAVNVLYTLWLRLVTTGSKGACIEFGRRIRITPGSFVELGNKVHLGDNVVLEIGVNPRAQLRVASNSWISHDCHILCLQRVEIGANVLIGDFVSIRDSTHQFGDTDVPIKAQGDIYGSIVVEDNVWIGRGCLIQGKPGAIVIGSGAVVAANSVVSNSIPRFEVWGGTPAKFIRRRMPKT